MLLSRITLYPIKSLPGADVPQARVLASGALEHDRRFVMVDAAGQWINGKRTPRVHPVRAEFTFDPAGALLRVRLDGAVQSAAEFTLPDDLAAAAAWLSAELEQDVQLLENAAAGFPDDTESPGPTLVSTGSLEAVATWFPGLSLEAVRQRFRANLEVGEVPAFWEDQLCGPPGETVQFLAGSLPLEGVNPCQRCVVPSRDAATGDVWPGFARTFSQQREAWLPPWAPRERFDHFYRLAVNTRPPAEHRPGVLAVGDAVRIVRAG